MKKSLHALSVVLIIMLQFSCNNRPNLIPEVRDVDFSNKDLEVEGKFVTEIIGAKSIFEYDTLLLVLTYNPAAQLMVFNTNTLDTLGEFCIQGRARNEFQELHTSVCQMYEKEGDVFATLYDGPYLVKEVNITESIRQGSTVVSNTVDVMRLGKGPTVFLNKNLNQKFELLDNKYKPDEEMREVPSVYTVKIPDKKDKELKILRRVVYVEEDQKRFIPYDSTIKKHPSKNIIVNMFRGLDYLVFFDLDNDKTFAIHQTGSATFDDEPYVDTGEYHFSGAAHCAEDYVMLVYNHGKDAMNEPDRSKRKAEVIIFDWEGNFITNIRLDRRIAFIGYDESQEKLFGITFREEIYEYDLSGLLP